MTETDSKDRLKVCSKNGPDRVEVEKARFVGLVQEPGAAVAQPKLVNIDLEQNGKAVHGGNRGKKKIILICVV
jgi:hypothetical protein